MADHVKEVEETQAEQEEADAQRTASFDPQEMQDEVQDITPQEKQAMMSKPVEYADSYVPPSDKEPEYNPGSYTRLGDRYYEKNEQGEQYREQVREGAQVFQQTPVFQTLSQVSAYKTRLQSDAWNNSPKDSNGLGTTLGWDKNNWFGAMGKAKVTKGESGLYGMSNGIRYAIPGAKSSGKKVVTANHPFAVNLFGGYGSYKTTNNPKEIPTPRVKGSGLPIDFFNSGSSQTNQKTNAKPTPWDIMRQLPDNKGGMPPLFELPTDKKKRTAAIKELRGMTGMYSRRPDGEPEYNPGQYSILGANYVSSQKQKVDVQKDAMVFMNTTAYTELAKDSTERLAGQSESSFLYGKDVDKDSFDKVREREMQPGLFTDEYGERRQGKMLPKNLLPAQKKEQVKYTPLGANYLNPDAKYKGARTVVRHKAELFQKSKEYDTAVKINDRKIEAQSKAWTIIPKGKPPLDPTTEGFAMHGEGGRDKLQKKDKPHYGGIPYIIPAALYAKNKNKPLSEPTIDGEGVKGTGYQGNTGSMGGGSPPPNKKPPSGSKQEQRETRWRKMSPYQKELFGNVMPEGGVSAGELEDAISREKTRATKFNKQETKPFISEMKMHINTGGGGYLYSTPGKTNAEEKRASSAAAAYNRQVEFEKLPEHERYAFYGNVVPSNYSKKMHEENLRLRARKNERVSSSIRTKEELADVLERQKQSERNVQTTRLDRLVMGGKADYITKSERQDYTKRNINEIIDRGAAHEKSETTRLDKLVFGGKADYISKHDYTGYVTRNVDKIVEKETKETSEKERGESKDIANARDAAMNEGVYQVKKKALFDKKQTPESRFWNVVTGKTYESEDKQRKKLVSDEWKEKHPLATALGGVLNPSPTLKKYKDDLMAGRKARAEENRRSFFYGGGLQPVNITKGNPEGEFPKQTGKTAMRRHKNPVTGTELSFFGKPFGAPKAPRRTRRGKVIKLTPAQRKRNSRKPKSFLDDVFGSRW